MVLSVHARERIAVEAEELDFLRTIAHLVAIAVDRAKYLEGERMQTERLRRTLHISSSLMELVLAGSAMSAVVGVIGTILPDPILVLDLVTLRCETVRSPRPDLLGDREWSELAQGKAAALLIRLAQASDTGGLTTPQRLDLAELGVPLDVAVLVEPLRVEGETLGALMIFPRERPLDSLDRLVVQEVRFALGVQLMRHHVEARREALDLSLFFERLCDAGEAEPERVRMRAARVGIDLARPIRLLALAPPARGGPAQLVEMRRIVARSLVHAAPGAFVIEHRATVVLGVPAAELSEQQLTAILERHVLGPVRWRWRAAPALAVGPVCHRPGDYAAAWEECRRVLDLAHMFRRDGILRQDDFGPFALLLSAFDASLVRAFVEKTVAPIRAYDRDNATALLETAAVFIEEGCRYQGTAEAIGIHVSTLRYRLKRMQELFGLDLEDADTRFRLALALRLHALAAPASGS